ncbi:hypothetical protein D3C87_850840 [compost metagenome]
MRDIQLPMRIAYIAKLTALGLTVYEMDAVPQNAPTPYVIIGEFLSSEISDKTHFGHKASQLLDIVTKSPKNKVEGSKEVDLLANQIFGVINSKAPFIINDDLQSVNIKIIQDKKLNAIVETDRVYRRLIRFEHTIRQLN